MKIPNGIVQQLHVLNCEEVATMLGIEVRRHMAHCFKHEDRNPSLGFRGNHWKCFSCNIGGDAINLVEILYSISFTDACILLANKFNIYIPNLDSKNNKQINEIIAKPLRISEQSASETKFDNDVANYIMNHTLLTKIGETFLYNERKIKSEVVDSLRLHSIEEPSELKEGLISKFGIERLKKCKVLSNNINYTTINIPSLIIPYYDENGHLIGIQTRYLGEIKSGKPIPRFKRLCNSSIRIYNLPIINKLEYNSNLFITEGITDCLAMLSAGFNSVAIPSATSFPIEDLIKIKDFNVFMVADQDNAGYESYLRLYRIMLRYGCEIKKINLPTGFKDYNEYYIYIQNQNN